MIVVYSLKADAEKQVSKNFKVREFACKDGSDAVFIDTDLIDILQTVRNYVNRPITITSGYRTVAHNKSVGGSTYSQHIYGRAADFQISGMSPEVIAPYVETVLNGEGGLGIYPATSKRKGWLHVDTREVKSRWKG